MFNALLLSALCLTSFAVCPGFEDRALKMAIALCFAIGLGAVELFSSGFKPIRNIWLILFLAYLPLSIYLAPCPTIDLVGIQVMNFWSWQPAFKILAFFLLFCAIKSHKFSHTDIRMILQVMLWCGCLTGIYHIVQYFNADQFFATKAYGDFGKVAGFIGHPILSASFLAILFPIALYFKNYIKGGIMLTGILLADSQTAIVAVALGSLVYFSSKSLSRLFVGFISIICIGLVFGCLWSGNSSFRGKFNDHERYAQWTTIVKDCMGPLNIDKGIKNKMAVTGRGIGAFRFVYRVEHPNLIKDTNQMGNGYEQAHNEYLELWYGMGLIGVCLFLMALWDSLKKYWRGNRCNRALLSCLITSALCAIPIFVWQIGPIAFYSVILAGMFCNDELAESWDLAA